MDKTSLFITLFFVALVALYFIGKVINLDRLMGF